jgi:hypothetical protein
LPLLGSPATTLAPDGRGFDPRFSGGRQMGERQQMRTLEDQVRRYEEELARLRVENEQLRRSSQAFGELAERLSIALNTATRVNKRTAGDVGARLHVTAPES